jgi:3-oxoacyl-[acyl-carrier protein] reductase
VHRQRPTCSASNKSMLCVRGLISDMLRQEHALRDKTVIVTGGSRGIGFAAARAFLDSGARVAICAVNQKRLSEAQAQLGSRERLFAMIADVVDPGEVQNFVSAASAALGPIGVLVNNAGVLYAGSFVNEPIESVSRVIDVNLKGVMYMTRAVLPAMVARRGGVIVNVASGAGLSAFPEIASYCASKFGVVGFSQALSEEVHKFGVRVYALCPGRVATDMQAQYSGAKIGIAPEKVARRIVELAAAKRGLFDRCVVMIS